MEVGGIVHLLDRRLGSGPKLDERTIVLERTGSGVLVPHAFDRIERPVHEAYDLADRYRCRISGEKVAPLDAASRLDQSRRPQLVEDVLEESLGYRLIRCDLADGHGSLAIVFCQLKTGPHGILALLGQIHI